MNTKLSYKTIKIKQGNYMKEKLYLFNRDLYWFLDEKIFYVKVINILFFIQTIITLSLVIIGMNNIKELFYGSFSILFITSFIIIFHYISECIDTKYGMKKLMEKPYHEIKQILKGHKQLKQAFEEAIKKSKND